MKSQSDEILLCRVVAIFLNSLCVHLVEFVRKGQRGGDVLRGMWAKNAKNFGVDIDF